MEKYFKCNEIIYGDNYTPVVRVEYILVKTCYNKNEGGYCVEVKPVSKDDYGYGMFYSKEYYDNYYGYIMLLYPCGKKSKKAEEKINKEVFEGDYANIGKARAYALHYLTMINQRTGRNIKLCQE